jgi:hypothetical protein
MCQTCGQTGHWNDLLIERWHHVAICNDLFNSISARGSPTSGAGWLCPSFAGQILMFLLPEMGHGVTPLTHSLTQWSRRLCALCSSPWRWPWHRPISLTRYRAFICQPRHATHPPAPPTDNVVTAASAHTSCTHTLCPVFFCAPTRCSAAPPLLAPTQPPFRPLDHVFLSRVWSALSVDSRAREQRSDL